MYLALYRKYRPNTFDDVISQEHITTTLKNQIASGQIAHAYLFTGTRGTGKTSCSKIMAKAVNCLSPVNGNPCGECAACKAIENGSTDIIEMDAASNNGVDSIRQIRDEVIYTPIDCKYKVYIIDEVHMLSDSAFNALLKTLEEPPEHAVFILATTEYYKVPATILSRCQQFLFSKIDPEESKKRLLEIAEKENISLDENAAALIARLSDGAMRDALSLLDQCISTTGDTIDEETVRKCSGVADSGYLFGISEAAVKRAPAEALKILGDLITAGKDLCRLVEELTLHYRNLMLAKTVDVSFIKGTDEELERYRTQSDALSLDEIMRQVDLVSGSLDNINRMKQTGQARLLTEQLLIRLAAPKLNNDNASLAARLGAMESRLDRLSAANTFNEAGAADDTIKTVKSKEIYQEKKTEAPAALPENKKEENRSEPEKEIFPEQKKEVPQEPEGELFFGADEDIPLPEPPAFEAEQVGAYGLEYGDNFYGEAPPLPAENGTKDEIFPQSEYSERLPAENDETAAQTETEPAAELEGQGFLFEPADEKSTTEDKPVLKQESGRKREENENTPENESSAERTENDTAELPIPESDIQLPADIAPLAQWNEIISLLPVSAKSILKSAKAFLYGGRIYIEAPPAAHSMLENGKRASKLRDAAATVLGGRFEIFSLGEKAHEEEIGEDLVTPLLERAREMGIKVEVRTS